MCRRRPCFTAHATPPWLACADVAQMAHTGGVTRLRARSMAHLDLTGNRGMLEPAENARRFMGIGGPCLDPLTECADCRSAHAAVLVHEPPHLHLLFRFSSKPAIAHRLGIVLPQPKPRAFPLGTAESDVPDRRGIGVDLRLVHARDARRPGVAKLLRPRGVNQAGRVLARREGGYPARRAGRCIRLARVPGPALPEGRVPHRRVITPASRCTAVTST